MSYQVPMRLIGLDSEGACRCAHLRTGSSATVVHGVHESPAMRQREGSVPLPSGVFAWLLLLLVVAAGGCAGYWPDPISSVPFLARSQTKSEHGIRVTVAAPSDE